MGIDPTAARPTYRQIADQLRDQIHSGERRLPSERALADRYGVGPMTVRQAIRTLQQEGLLDARPGRGLFVRERRPFVQYRRAAFNTGWQSWREALARQGHTGGQRIREVTVVTSPPEIAALLGLGDDDPVLVRCRLLLIGNEPAQIADSYYPHRLAEGTPIAGSEPVTAGLLRSLEAAGVTLDRADEQWTTRMPTPSEASLLRLRLRLRRGVPVLRFLSTLYDTSGTAVCVTDSILAGDRHALLFETAVGRPSPAQEADSGWRSGRCATSCGHTTKRSPCHCTVSTWWPICSPLIGSRRKRPNSVVHDSSAAAASCAASSAEPVSRRQRAASTLQRMPGRRDTPVRTPSPAYRRRQTRRCPAPRRVSARGLGQPLRRAEQALPCLAELGKHLLDPRADKHRSFQPRPSSARATANSSSKRSATNSASASGTKPAARAAAPRSNATSWTWNPSRCAASAAWRRRHGRNPCSHGPARRYARRRRRHGSPPASRGSTRKQVTGR